MPTAVMVGFIIWAVYESTVSNQTSVIELDNVRCLIRTSYSNFAAWLDQESTDGTNVLSVAGGSKVLAIVAKEDGVDCGDVYSE